MSREAFDIEAALDKCHKGTAWQRDLIRAQLIAAQADAFERAAKLCDTHYAGPICAVIFEHENETAQVLAGFIRALAREAK